MNNVYASSESRNEFRRSTFTGSERGTQTMARLVQEHLGDRPGTSILDIGCGTGRLLFELTGLLARVCCTGVDISPENIARCQEKHSESGFENRLGFVCLDYIQRSLGSFDVIISDSVFQNIQSRREMLFGKVVSELNSEGLLVMNMPHDCFYNRALWMLRRFLRTFKGRTTDRLVAKTAKALHPEMDMAFIQERIMYTYMVPFCVYDQRLKQFLSAQGMRILSEHDAAHASFGQPKHTISVWQKVTS